MRGLDAQTRPHDNNACFNEQFWPGSLLHGVGQARKEVADEQSKHECNDITELASHTHGPGQTHFGGLFLGCGYVGVMSQKPAQVGKPESKSEGKGKPGYIRSKGDCAQRHDHQRKEKGEKQ